jgi:hypothetical protein
MECILHGQAFRAGSGPGESIAKRQFPAGKALSSPLLITFPGDCMKTEFGWIEIGGTRYDHDIVIHTDGTVSKRKKKLSKPYAGEYGHTPLATEELAFLKSERPAVVYIGTGQYGDLPLTPDAIDLLETYEPVVKPTPDLLSLLEKEQRNYAAVLHVTC